METGTHRSLTPCAAALGMSQPEAGGGRAVACLPPSPQVARVDGSIEPLALLPFLDELASHAVLSLGLGAEGMATIELRLDFLTSAAPGPVSGRAEALGGRAGAQFARADARDAGGRLVAAGQLWFATGSFPGRAGEPVSAWPAAPVLPDAPVGERDERRLERRFEPLIGLTRAAASARLAATAASVGWTGLPAVHGGIVAVLLAAAGEAALARPGLALAAISVRYLKAVPATGASAKAELRKAGRRSCHLHALCLAEADGGSGAGYGRTLAEADLLFLAAPTLKGEGVQDAHH